MKGFIVASCILAVVSAGYAGHQQPQHIPVIDPHGFAVDTPEVAHAKAAHYAAHAKAGGQAGHYSAPAPVAAPAQYTNHGAYSAPAPYTNHGAYSAPAPYTNQGLYSAPAVHSAPAAYADQHYPGYIPSYDNNGYQLDTPEVAHAKAAHLAELAKVKSTGSDDGSYNHGYAQPAPYHGSTYAHAAPYNAPAPVAYNHAAAPVVHGGVPVDTPEVAHAKAAHFAAHSQALSRAGPQHQQHY